MQGRQDQQAVPADVEPVEAVSNLGPDARALDLGPALHQGHVPLLPVEAVLACVPGLEALLIPDGRALYQLTLRKKSTPGSERQGLVTSENLSVPCTHALELAVLVRL